MMLILSLLIFAVFCGGEYCDTCKYFKNCDDYEDLKSLVGKHKVILNEINFEKGDIEVGPKHIVGFECYVEGNVHTMELKLGHLDINDYHFVIEDWDDWSFRAEDVFDHDDVGMNMYYFGEGEDYDYIEGDSQPGQENSIYKSLDYSYVSDSPEEARDRKKKRRKMKRRRRRR